MSAQKNLDELSFESRQYYERAHMKLSLSLVFAAFAFMFLGFACQTGAKSNYASNALESNFVTGDTKDMLETQQSGYGFSCFIHILAFILSSAVSLYLSPFISSSNESKMLTVPQELETTSSPTVASVVSSSPETRQSTGKSDLYSGYPDPQSKIGNRV